MKSMARDMHPNPGLRDADIFPCRLCQIIVSWSNSNIACEECELWYHRSSLSSSKYDELGRSSYFWMCFKYHTVN